jgi:hypothetical protein
MTQIYSYTSDQQPSDYWSTIRWYRPDPELDIQIDPNDPNYEEKTKGLEIRREQKWAQTKKRHAIENAIDQARVDRLAESMSDPDTIRDILSDLTRVQLQIFIFCIDRPDQMFTPRDLCVNCKSVRNWAEAEEQRSGGVSKSALVREQCELLALQHGIGVVIADPEDFKNGKFEYGFGFLWDEEREVPEIPHQLETLLGRKSNIQIAHEFEGMRKRDREIVAATRQETKAQLEKLAELQQRFVESNARFLSENVRSWRVPKLLGGDNA